MTSLMNLMSRSLHRGAMATGPMIMDIQGAAGATASPITIASYVIMGVALGRRRHGRFARRLRAAFVAMLQVLENVDGLSVVQFTALLAAIAFAAEFALAACGIVLDLP
jgi:hypothetical protein